MGKNKQTLLDKIKERKHILLKTYLILFVVFIVICVYIFFHLNFVRPAYYSMVGVCYENGDNISREAGFVKAGSFTYSSVPENITPLSGYTIVDSKEMTYNTKIEIYQDEIYNDVLKHELCHQRQLEEGRMYNCNFKIGAFLNELECYIKDKF